MPAPLRLPDFAPGGYVLDVRDGGWSKGGGYLQFRLKGVITFRELIEHRIGMGYEPQLFRVRNPRWRFVPLWWSENEPTKLLSQLRLAGWKGNDPATIRDDVLKQRWLYVVCSHVVKERDEKKRPTMWKERWDLWLEPHDPGLRIETTEEIRREGEGIVTRLVGGRG